MKQMDVIERTCFLKESEGARYMHHRNWFLGHPQSRMAGQIHPVPRCRQTHNAFDPEMA